ncbi:MAG: c-type cytochrome [SAR324 cluster bacterium]|nr:c-type cytochrome [SAR324 cluster bacterium]
MKKWLASGLMALVCLGIGMNVNAAGDAAAGKANFAVCSSCHGANGEGNQALNAPSIAGQEEWYVVRQLQNFKAGVRGLHPKDMYGAQMRPMAMTLADEKAIENVAAYIQTLKAVKPVATGSGKVDAGKAVFMVCSSCHGPNGEGNKALNAPKLSTLPDWYIVRQISNFKAGIRGADPKDIFGAQMRPMAMTVASDQAAADVAAYINSLK